MGSCRLGVSGDGEILEGSLLPASVRDRGLLCAGVDCAEARLDGIGSEESNERPFIESATAVPGTAEAPAAAWVFFPY